MFQIVRKQSMAKGTIIRQDVIAPRIAKKIQAGQFIVLRVNETGERIPLTVAHADPLAGTITIIFQVVGKTTALLGSLNEGDSILDIAGPLGKPAEAKKFGTVVMVGGGTGVAILYHVTTAMKAAGNYVIGIIGSREKDMLILEDEMREVCDELYITTDDGTAGHKGFVTDPLKTLLEDRKDIKLAYAIGPIIMMKNVTKMTKEYNTPTMVSLNPIMIDGTGMCGGCRVSVGGKTKFACVDGPDFDGHLVDFEQLENRNRLYEEDEKVCMLHSIHK
ncbi:MAG: sulfide/dihydroorotate dehydrogenase-like FAD/NAD-binding protein [Bacteroidales bacterium]|nr:sulfide/dihydroorotate dehydrogenase-like FAD/NAD-binding protein [Bacteroidales bacterium]